MVTRRPISRQNRGRKSSARAAASGPAPFSPSDISGLVLWNDSDYTTDTGNGTACSVLLDRSATGANMAEASAGVGAIRRDATGRRPRFVEFTPGKVHTSVNATIIALGTGAAQSRTVFDVYQLPQAPLGATVYPWGWGNTGSTTEYTQHQYAASSYHKATATRSSGVNLTYIAGAYDNGCPRTMATRWNHVAGTLQYRTDGVNETAVTTAALGSGARNVFAYGRRATSAPTDSDYTWLRHRLFYNRALSDAELIQLETWADAQMGPQGLGWKAGYTRSASFGNGTNAWLVIACIGQSNMVGADTDLYTGDGTTTGVYALRQDGNLDEFTTEPAWDATNAPFTQSATGGTSCTRKLAELLRAAGETRNILIVPVAKGSTTSTNWANNSATEPPPIGSSNPIGFAKHWIDEALKAPNSELVFVLYQGEDNATSAPLAAAWSSDWVLVQDSMNTRYSSKIVKAKPWFVVQLPATAGSGGFATAWSTVRVNQSTHCTVTRTDSTLVTFSGEVYIDGVHCDKATMINQLAPALATAIWAGT